MGAVIVQGPKTSQSVIPTTMDTSEKPFPDVTASSEGGTDHVLPPPCLLADELIELKLLRTVGPGDLTSRTPEAQFLNRALEYRFAIHRRSDNLRVGRIHLRVTDDPIILGAVGHMGYAVDEAHRRHGYATHAIRLIISLAYHFGVGPLWVLIETANIASRRAAERAGFRLHDEVDTRPEALALGVGPRVCRYVIKQQ